jgi:hypothetical protein
VVADALAAAVVVACGAEVVVDGPNEKDGAEGADVAAGCEVAAVVGGPNEKGFAAGAEVAVEVVVAFSDVVDGAVPPPRLKPLKRGF